MFKKKLRDARVKAIVLLLVVVTVAVAGSAISNFSRAADVQKIPYPFIGGYLEAWYNVRPRDLPSNYNVLFYAFARVDINGNIEPFWHAPDKAALIADIAAMKAAGKPVILSIGGSHLVKQPPKKGVIADNYVNGLRPLIDEYGFSGIDWDVEGEVLSTDPAHMDAVAAGMVDVSYRLKNHYSAQGKPFFITMAPYFDPAVIGTYQRAARGMLPILTMINYQFYNNSNPPTYTFVRDTLDAWKTAVPGLQNNQWSLGFLHVDDWQGNTTSYQAMRDIWTGMHANRPGVQGVWSWGIGEKETPKGYPFQRELSPTVFGSILPPPSMPDVVVTNITLNPVSPVEGNQVVFSATIKNQGTVATPADQPVGISFSVNGAKKTWSSRAALAAGESAVLTASNSDVVPGTNYWTAVSGSHTVEAFVDDVNRFAETNESNNKLTKSFTVASAMSTATPSAPPAVIGAVTANTIALDWAPPSQPNGTITGYRIGWSSSNGLPVPSWSEVKTLPADPFVLINLSNTATYTIWIEAINANGTGARTTLTAKPLASAASPDINGDGKINSLDLSVVLSRDGQQYAAADFNGDGVVGAADIAILLGKWTW